MLVNLESGQKQLESLLDLHFGIRVSQVLMHLGTELGHGAEGTAEGEVGAGCATVVSDSEPVTGEFPVGMPVGAHLVQTVEVEVRVTVETVEYVVGISEPPEVMVVVTGQVVTVS